MATSVKGKAKRYLYDVGWQQDLQTIDQIRDATTGYC